MKPEPIYRERLLLLADFLEKLPAERFDYRRWVGRDWAGAPDLSCGTTACALGWATTMPEFRALGLRLVPYLGDGSFVALAGNEYSHLSPTDYAAEVVFGLEGEEPSFLFRPGDGATYDDLSAEDQPAGDATPAEVAEHIRRFVELRSSQIEATR